MNSPIVVTMLILLSGRAMAADITEFPGLVRQTLQLEASDGNGTTRTFEAMVIKPDGAGPFPLALITHGTNRLGAVDTIRQERPQTYTAPALFFAQRGYASVVVMRSGFGNSPGPYEASIGLCQDPDYIKSSKTEAADVLMALSALQKKPWVDPLHVLLIGHSTGGLAVTAAGASNPRGVLGIISFAGTNGSARRDYICRPDRLVDAVRVFGVTARVPSLWVYAENDHFVSPDIAKRMFDAYTVAGAPAKLFLASATGNDGHSLVWAPNAPWWPEVATFLKSLKLPTEMVSPIAAVAILPPYASLDDAGRAAFESYLRSQSYEKAFAVAIDSPDRWAHKGWGWVSMQRTEADAAEAALNECQMSGRTCQIYAVGDHLASDHRRE